MASATCWLVWGAAAVATAAAMMMVFSLHRCIFPEIHHNHNDLSEALFTLYACNYITLFLKNAMMRSRMIAY